jgi:hypothetical protein
MIVKTMNNYLKFLHVTATLLHAAGKKEDFFLKTCYHNVIFAIAKKIK